MPSSFATSCRFVLRRRRALRDVVHRRGCLCLGRLDLAHRRAVEGEAVLATLRSGGGRCGGTLTQHRRQAVPEVVLS